LIASLECDLRMVGGGVGVEKEMDREGRKGEGRAGKKEVGGRGRAEIQRASSMTRRSEAAI
jgi:hypothetical protein